MRLGCALLSTLLAASAGAAAGEQHGPAAIPAAARDPGRLWCNEHGVYEDECTICHPELATEPAKPAGPMCDEHRLRESECGICHPELAAGLAAGEGLKIRFASAQSTAKAGVEAAPPEVVPMVAAVECFGELVFDQGRFAHAAALVDGVVRGVGVDLGHRVGEGAALATLWSSDVAAAKGAYVGALADAALRRKTLERERRLRKASVSSERELQEAEAAARAAAAAVAAARQHLVTLGLGDDDVASLERHPESPPLIDVRAPLAGEIIERRAVTGSFVAAGTPLFTVADPSLLWAMLQVPQSDLADVDIGRRVEISVEAAPDRTFAGTVTWISPQVDERTRLTTVRAEVANPDGALRAHSFVRARIVTARGEKALLVPGAAIQRISGQPWLFVELEPDLYEARPVRLGAKRNGRVEVVAGLAAADRVVVARSYVLKSELLKSRLGAACVDE
jgi:cobalt-zinc-cadmium efflux system membrane fusion protein